MAGQAFCVDADVEAEEARQAHGLNALDQLSISEIHGKQQVLAFAPRLRDLAAQCGQAGVLDHLNYYLSVPYFGSKLPCVLLFHAEGGALSPGLDQEPADSASSPVAAVFLHEYRLLGVRTGVYIPADLAGDWTIIAPKDIRHKIAQLAGAHLLQGGATTVLLSCAAQGGSPSFDRLEGPIAAGLQPVASAERPMLRTLPLAGTPEATLGRMGAHTRRNLRLARRRAVAKLQVTFVPEAAISEAEFLEINREGFYPVPDAVARWRYRSVHEVPGGFLAGVCTGEGVWLALLGGRRYRAAGGVCTVVDWQLNRTHFARFSPGSLIRTFLIEHEIASGTAFLRFQGGTPHSMRSAFAPELVHEWLYARPRLSAAWLRRLGKVLPKGNLLGDFLHSSQIRWRDCTP